jgi:hypothetical protein
MHQIKRALALLALILLTACGGKPDAPALTMTSVEGATIELNEKTPLTALFFFSISNPVAIGAFERLPDRIDSRAETVGIAMHVDRPPNVLDMQQRTLVPIAIDEGGRIAEAFGGIALTPTLILVREGKILLHQQGQLDYDAVNATIVIQ